jgi:hypothetical protein
MLDEWVANFEPRPAVAAVRKQGDEYQTLTKSSASAHMRLTEESIARGAESHGLGAYRE